MKTKILFFAVVSFICALQEVRAQLPPDTIHRPHDTIPYPWKGASADSLKTKKQRPSNDQKKDQKNTAPESTIPQDQKKKKPK